MGWMPAMASLANGKPKCDRAHQFAIYINRAAAHALDDARVGQRTAGQLGEDDGLLRAGAFQDAQNLHLELFYLIATKDSFADAMESGPDVSEREKRTGCRCFGGGSSRQSA